MQELSGQRKGTKKFFYNGYFYHIDPRYPNIRDTYICSKRFTEWQCFATAQTRVDGVVTVKGEHYHPTVPFEENQRLEEFKNRLKDLGRTSVDSPDTIYKFLRQEYSDVAHLILQTSAKMHIIRERSKLRPKLPENFAEIGKALEKYKPAEKIYRTQLRVSETSSAIIFASVEMMAQLNDCQEIYVDGTFKCVPKGVGAKQLLILHIRKMNVGMACVFVLCSNQTTELYVRVWNFLLESAPGLRKNLKSVMMDFERALIKSVKDIMPWVTIKGCWFHFTRAISSYWHDLGLRNVSSTRVQDILSLAWVLPLLPAENFAEAIEFYRQKASQVESEYEDVVNKFIDYLQNQWLRIAEIVSLWRSPNRTNNVCESFHRRLLKRLGHHPNLFVFIGKLASVISDIEATWRHLEHDGNAVGSKCQKQSSIDSYINHQQLALENRKLNVSEFLMKTKTKNIKEFIQYKLYSPHYSTKLNPQEPLSPQELIHLLGYPQQAEPTKNTPAKLLTIMRPKQSITVQKMKIVQAPDATQQSEVISEPVIARQIQIMQGPEPQQHVEIISGPVEPQELDVMWTLKPLQQLEAMTEQINVQKLEVIQMPQTTQLIEIKSDSKNMEEFRIKPNHSIIIEMGLESEVGAFDKKPNVMPKSMIMPGRLKVKKNLVRKRKQQDWVGCSSQVPIRVALNKELRSQSPSKRIRKRRAMSPAPEIIMKKVKKPLRQPLQEEEPRYKLSPDTKKALDKIQKQKQLHSQPKGDNEPRYKFSPSFKTFLKKKEKLKACLDSGLKRFVNSFE